MNSNKNLREVEVSPDGRYVRVSQNTATIKNRTTPTNDFRGTTIEYLMYAHICVIYFPPYPFVQFDEKLGNGAYKEVFLAYDTETGKEVAWNTVTLARLPPNEKKRIRMETEILKELDHPHIINFFHVWENPDRGQK